MRKLLQTSINYCIHGILPLQCMDTAEPVHVSLLCHVSLDQTVPPSSLGQRLTDVFDAVDREGGPSRVEEELPVFVGIEEEAKA